MTEPLFLNNLTQDIFRALAGDNFEGLFVLPGDVDGDGDLDLVISSDENSSGNTIQWFENNGDGTSWSRNQIPVFKVRSGIQAPFVVTDIDNDGDLDILTTQRNSSNSFVLLLENTGNGESWNEILAGPSILPIGSTEPFSIVSVDLDSDGDLDILAASGNQIEWVSNNGDGTWDETLSSDITVPTTNLSAITTVISFDVDGDDDNDIVVLDSTGIYLFTNDDGLGTSWTQSSIDAAFPSSASTFEITPPQLFAEDVDGDGNVDILGLSNDLDEIAWWKNNGDGSTWTKEVIASNFTNAQSFSTSDLDLDGDIDVVGSTTAGNIIWWENNGDGTSWTATNIRDASAANFEFTSITTADLDGSGSDDIVFLVNDTSLDEPFSAQWITNELVVLKEGDTVSIDALLDSRAEFGLVDTAINGEDYDFAGGTLTAIDDGIYDPEPKYLGALSFELFPATGRGRIVILDNEPLVSISDFTPIISEQFGDSDDPAIIGYVDLTLDNPVPGEPGMLIQYSLEGSSSVSAVQGEDFYNSQADISTTDGIPPTNSIFIPQGESSARIYLTAIPDAIDEEDATITLTVLPDNLEFETAISFTEGSFDASREDLLEIPSIEANNFDVDDDFTVEAWIQADLIQGLSGSISVIEKWDNSSTPDIYPFAIRYNSNTGKIDVSRSDGSITPTITSTTLFNDGEFHHVAFVKDGESLSLYVDGLLEGSSIEDTTVNTTQNNSSIYLGGRIGGITNSPFFGDLDELRIWDTARSQDEIQNNRLETLNGDEDNLVAYYNFDFDESSDVTRLVPDLTANANDAITPYVDLSLSFDGIDDNVQISTDLGNFTADDSVTIALWFKTTASSGTLLSSVVDSNNPSNDPFWRFSLDETGRVVFSSSTFNDKPIPPITSENSLNDGEWHQVILISEESFSTSFYIDGSFEATTSVTPISPFPGGTLSTFIGSFGDSDYFAGEIDTIEVYDDAFSGTSESGIRDLFYEDILEDGEDQFPPSNPNLLAYYTFEDGEAIDIAGNGNDGTISGASALINDRNESSVQFEENSLSANPFATGSPSYGVDENAQSVTINLLDDPTYTAGIAIANVFGEEAIANPPVANEAGEATFSIKLTSQPTDDVVITLTSTSSTLSETSLTFTASDWDTFQRS